MKQDYLAPLQKNGEKPILYLVHGMGGNSLNFIPLSEAIGKNFPVYIFKSQGLEDGKQPLTNIPDLAAFYLEQIQKHQPEGPYILGGWSMGGVIAYEMAWQLQQQGIRDTKLILLSTYVQEHIAVMNQSGKLQLEDADIMNLLLKENPDHVLQLLQKANHQAWRAYRPQGFYNGQVTYVHAENQIGTGEKTLTAEAKQEILRDVLTVWRKYLNLQEKDILRLDADHFSMLQLPVVGQLAEYLMLII